MKKYNFWLEYISVSLLFLSAFMLFPQISFASVYIFQPNHSVNVGNNFIAHTEVGITGSFNQVQWYQDVASGSSGLPVGGITGTYDATGSSGVGANWASIAGAIDNSTLYWSTSGSGVNAIITSCITITGNTVNGTMVLSSGSIFGTANSFTQSYYGNVYGDAYHGHVAVTFSYNSICNSPPPLDISTRFVSLSPTASTTATGNVDFSVQYYWNNATTSYQNLALEILREDANFQTATSTVIYGINSIVPNVLTTLNRTVPLSTNGAYQWRASMQATSTSGVLYNSYSSAWQSFYTVTNPYPNIIGTTDLNTVYTIATSTCSFTNISGCFQNALVWAFYPSESILNNYKNLPALMKDRVPISYFYGTHELFSSLSSTATSSSSLNMSLDLPGLNMGNVQLLNLNPSVQFPGLASNFKTVFRYVLYFLLFDYALIRAWSFLGHKKD